MKRNFLSPPVWFIWGIGLKGRAWKTLQSHPLFTSLQNNEFVHQHPPKAYGNLNSAPESFIFLFFSQNICIYMGFFNIRFYIFISVFTFVCAESSLRWELFSSCSGRGLLSSCSVQASRCGELEAGASVTASTGSRAHGLQQLQHVGAVIVASGL